MTEKAAEALSLDAPWMARKDWADGRIRSAGMAQIVMLWLMAVLWNGFSWTWIALIWGDPEENTVVRVLSLFCLVGLLLFVWAVRRTLVWRRFGQSVLELASIPGVIGGTLEGRIETGLQTLPAKPIQLVLTCFRQYRVEGSVQHHGRDRESNLVRDALWQTDLGVAGSRLIHGPRGLTIPLRIAIPYGLPSSDSSDLDNQILWQLAVSCDLPGVDFRADFLVPVFFTANSSSEWTEEKVDEMALQEREADFPPELQRSKFRVSPVTFKMTRSGGMEYVFRIDVPSKMAMGLTLLAVLVCAGAVGLYLWLGEMGPFAIFPGILGLLLLIASVTIWTFKSRVVVENGLVTVRKSVLGIPLIWRVPFSEISQVRVRHEMVEGVKEKDRTWEIEIDRNNKNPVKLGASIPDRTEAKRLAEEIRRLSR